MQDGGPGSLILGTLITWAVCVLLRFFIGGEFASTPVFAVSPAGLAAGALSGVVTVLLRRRPRPGGRRRSPLWRPRPETAEPFRRCAAQEGCFSEKRNGLWGSAMRQPPGKTGF